VAMVEVGLVEALVVTRAAVEATVAVWRAAAVAAVQASVGRVEAMGVAKVAVVKVEVAKAAGVPAVVATAVAAMAENRHASRSQDSQSRIRSY